MVEECVSLQVSFAQTHLHPIWAGGRLMISSNVVLVLCRHRWTRSGVIGMPRRRSCDVSSPVYWCGFSTFIQQRPVIHPDFSMREEWMYIQVCLFQSCSCRTTRLNQILVIKYF